MASPYARRTQEHRREQERRRRARKQREATEPPAQTPADDRPVPPEHRRAAATACGWCSAPLTPKSRGPVPKWCSASCRQRAWEQRRAAASGLCAVEVVERVVEVPARPEPRRLPRHHEWHGLLRELARQLDGGLVYDRHVTGVALEVRRVQAALARHPRWDGTDRRPGRN